MQKTNYNFSFSFFVQLYFLFTNKYEKNVLHKFGKRKRETVINLLIKISTYSKCNYHYGK